MEPGAPYANADMGAKLRDAVRSGALDKVHAILTAAGPNASYLVREPEPAGPKWDRQCSERGSSAISEEGYTAVHLAAMMNYAPILHALLEACPCALNSEVERGYSDHQVKKGLTPIMVAARNGYADVVKELVGQNAALNDKLENGKTALLFAAAKGHSGALAALLQEDKFTTSKDAADIDARDHNGDTALHHAVRLERHNIRQDVLDVLLSPQRFKKPNVAAVNKDGLTPLMLAIRNGHGDACDMLLQQQQNLNLTDGGGCTALHCAALQGNLSIVKTLCDAGANPLAESQSKMLPVDMADINGCTEVRKFLLPYTNATQLVETDGFRGILNGISIVAVLIVTVTFIGMQTPPGGGSDGEGGQLKLCRKGIDASGHSRCGHNGYKHELAINQDALKAYTVLDGLSLFWAAADLLLVLAFLLPGVSKRFRAGQRVAWVWCMLVSCSLLLAASLVCAVGAFLAAGFTVVPAEEYGLLGVISAFGGVVLLVALSVLFYFINSARSPDTFKFIWEGQLGLLGCRARGSEARAPPSHPAAGLPRQPREAGPFAWAAAHEGRLVSAPDGKHGSQQQSPMAPGARGDSGSLV